MTEKELWIEQRQIFRSRFTLIFRDYFAIMLADKSAYLLWFKISARANVQEISYRNYNYGNVISMLLLARRLQFIFLCDTWKRNSRKRGLNIKKHEASALEMKQKISPSNFSEKFDCICNQCWKFMNSSLIFKLKINFH